MPEDLPETVQPAPDSGAPPPGEPEGHSGSMSDLPEEFRPYSMIPWDSIPEESRGDVLQGVKKFHGGMTRNQQELADLRKQLPLYKQRSDLLDRLTREQWFVDAWERQNGGGMGGTAAPQPQQQQPPSKLSDHLDPQAAEAIETLISSTIAKTLQPFQDRLLSVQQQQVSSATELELDRIRTLAKQNGWPSPDEKLQEMHAIVAAGRAKDVDSAYKLAVFGDLPNVIATRTRASLQEELRRKADTTIPPSVGPSATPGRQLFVGTGCVEKALQDTLREFASRR